MRVHFLALFFIGGCGEKSSEQPCMDGYARSAGGQCEPASEETPADGDGTGTGDGSAGEPDTGDSTGSDDGTGTTDGADSGGGSSDGGGTDGDPPPPGITIETGAEVVCANPSARESQPFVPVDWGDGWVAQNFASSTSDPIVASGLTIEDFDGDGEYEIYIPQVGADQFYVQQSDGTYVDEASTRFPTPIDTPTTAGTAFDVEPDGDLDLLITRREGGLTLLINDGTGHFSDGTADAQLDRTAHPAVSATVADMDQDGDLDVFVITYRHCDTRMGWDPVNPYDDTTQSLWENQGDGTFADASAQISEHPGVNARLRAAAWFDADLDGKTDLYTISDKSVSTACMVTNQLFMNDGEDFTEGAAAAYLDLTMEGMGVALGDLNGDPYPDLVMSDMSRTWLMLSDGVGGWYETSMALQMYTEIDLLDQWSGWGTEFADFNNDGHMDIFMGFGGLADVPESEMNPWSQADALWLRDDDGYFEQVPESWGVRGDGSTRAVISTDINHDGWVDLAIREIGGAAKVWMANCGAASWTAVTLAQGGGNPNALGATVKVTVAGTEYRHWLTRGAAGLQSSEPMTAHFGLGSATSFDLEITWPDGEISSFEGVDVNQPVRVTRVP